MTAYLAGLVDRADPADPIARQFTPDRASSTRTRSTSPTPIGDDSIRRAKGSCIAIPTACC